MHKVILMMLLAIVSSSAKAEPTAGATFSDFIPLLVLIGLIFLYLQFKKHVRGENGTTNSSLIRCKDCGQTVSKNANACPHCGAKQRKTSLLTWAIVAFMLLVIFNVINSSDHSPTPKPSTSESSLDTGASKVSCDTNAALNVQSNLDELASRNEVNGIIEYRFKPFWVDLNNEKKLLMIQSAANVDACLIGHAREIRFYSPTGKLNGVATPTTGIRLVD